MLKRIRLENFMAHEATTIDLAPGVTVITGPNNIGKSAIVEALRYLLYNLPPKQVIRHGAKEAVVHLELDSGEIITWRRQDKHASYTLQVPGEPTRDYHKFGREVPEEIRTLLRLDQVVTDTGDRIDLHLGNQREPIFLLDRPGSHAAGFFAASTEADYLLKMQQALKRRREEAKRDQVRLLAGLEALAADLAQLEPLADLDGALQEAEALYELIAATQRRLPGWQDLWANLAETTARLQTARSAAMVLADLQTPPALADTAGPAAALEQLQRAVCRQDWENALAAVLIPLQEPPSLLPTASLVASAQAIDHTQAELAQAVAQDQVLATLATPPATLPTGELAAGIAKLDETTRQWQAEGARLTLLAALLPPPPLAAVEPLPRLLAELAEIRHALSSRQQRQALLAQTVPPPELYDLKPLVAMTEELAALAAAQKQHRQGEEVLMKLLAPPELAEVAALEETIGRLSHGLSDLEAKQEHGERLRQALAQKKSQIQAYLQEVGACPLCGSPLDLEHFLEERHD